MKSMKIENRRIIKSLILGLVIAAVVCMSKAYGWADGGNNVRHGYPKIAGLWGCPGGGTEYDRWAKYDLLVMSGIDQNTFRTFSKEVKKRNPRILLLSTGGFGYVGEGTPWMKEEWYVRRPDGKKASWWADKLFTPNILNDDCFNTMVDTTVNGIGEFIKEGALDGVFFDSVLGNTSWLGEIDLNGDGKADDPVVMDPKWHARQCLFFDKLRERMPGVLIMANNIDWGHAPHANGRLYEGGLLLDAMRYPMFSLNRFSPQDCIFILNTWAEKQLKPGITFATATHPLGWEFWRLGTTGTGEKLTTKGEVNRAGTDYSRVRSSLCTMLMADGYFGYDFGTVWWGHPFWYAEFEAPLGEALGPHREVFTPAPATVFEWKAGQSTDDFHLEKGATATDQGIVALNVDKSEKWHKLFSTGPNVHMEAGKTYRIIADCETLSRAPNAIFQFEVRPSDGGAQIPDCIRENEQVCKAAEKIWHIECTAMPRENGSHIVQWQLQQPGKMLLKSLKIMRIEKSYLIRDFEGGTVVMNPTSDTLTIPLKKQMRRLKDDAAPLHVIEIDDASQAFTADGDWTFERGEGHFYGETYRKASKAACTAAWSFTSPSSDTYTVFACIPGDKDRTEAAEYSIKGDGHTASVLVDQKVGDGGWTKLYTINLSKGKHYRIRLANSGSGFLVADALRLESAARFNDGSLVKSITLDSMDGTILLNTDGRK